MVVAFVFMWECISMLMARGTSSDDLIGGRCLQSEFWHDSWSLFCNSSLVLGADMDVRMDHDV